MKATDHFKRTIQAYLDNRAAEDELFAVSYRKEGKNIDDCIIYILNYVKNSGCAGFSDGEIYSQVYVVKQKCTSANIVLRFDF